MTDRSGDREDERDHRFSVGQGFTDPYDSFDFDPPELDVDPTKVDPVDDWVLTDILDERNVTADNVNAEELIDVGLSYAGINRFEQAIDTFARAARFTDDPAIQQEAWINKGVAHAEIEEYEEAIGAYLESLSIDDRGEFAALAETNLAYAYWEIGQDERALEHAERAVELDPRLPQAWFNRGFFLLERGLAEDAVRAFDNAHRLGLRSVNLYEEHARALEEAGMDEEAEEMANRAEEIKAEIEREMMS